MKLPAGRHNMKQLRAIMAQYRKRDIYMQTVGREARLPSGQRVRQVLPQFDAPERVAVKGTYRGLPYSVPRYGRAGTYEGRKNTADKLRELRRQHGRYSAVQRRFAIMEGLFESQNRRTERHIPLAKTKRKQRLIQQKLNSIKENQRKMRQASMEAARRLGEI